MIQERADFVQFANLIAQEPNANRRYIYRKAGHLFGLQTDELERALPLTPDELQAKDENEKLSENELVEISALDEHSVHLEFHALAKDTRATQAHIAAHKEALKVKKELPELFPQEQLVEGEPGAAAPSRPAVPARANLATIQ